MGAKELNLFLSEICNCIFSVDYFLIHLEFNKIVHLIEESS